jgi:branched-chain amino acid transport system permease protein
VARAGDFVVAVTPMALGSAALCLLAAIGVIGLMRLTRFGRAWRACADDPGAAQLMGVDRAAVLTRTFALAAALAGLAGTVITLHYGTLGYTGGIVLGIKALVAAVAGGIGSVPGAFLGGVLLGAAEALWSALLPIEHRELAIFALLIGLLILRPLGLFGFAEPLGKGP